MAKFSESSKMTSRTVLSFFLLFFSSLNFSEVDITTLSDWEIKSYSPHNLMVFKRGGSGSEYFGFTVDRPNCICGQPIFNLATTEPPDKEKKYKATISVDLKTPVEVLFSVLQTWEENDSTVLLRPLWFPSLAKAKVIDIKFEHSFKDIVFLTDGIEQVQEQSTDMCKQFFPYEELPKKAGMEISV